VLGLGGIGHLFGTRPLLGEIVEKLPGFTRAADVARQARALRDAVVDPDPVPSPLETIEAVGDWVERAAEADRAAQDAESRRRVLHRLSLEAEQQAARRTARRYCSGFADIWTRCWLISPTSWIAWTARRPPPRRSPMVPLKCGVSLGRFVTATNKFARHSSQ
jgi:hypothetical protein